MRFKWSVAILFSLLASLAFAQVPGKWHTEAASNALVSTLVLDRKHTIVIMNENDLVSFTIESPQYLKTQSKDVKAMIRYDGSIPQDFRMVNADHREAVVKQQKAREIIKKFGTTKKVDLRIYTHDDDYCDDLVFDTMVFNLPADTPTVVDKVLRGSN